MSLNIPRKWAIFIITTANFFLSQFYRASNAVIAPQLMNDLSLDTEGLGILSAAFFYGFAVTQIPITVFLDRIGPRRMITALSLIGVCGTFIFSGADTFTVGLLGRVLLGIGMACNLMGTLKLLTLWFDDTVFAALTGVVFSLGTLGNMAATTPLVLWVQQIGWRMTFQVIAIIHIFLIIIFWFVVRDAPGAVPSKYQKTGFSPGMQQILRQIVHLFKMRNYWIISIGTFVSYGIFSSFQTLWAGPYLMDASGLSAVHAGNIIFLMNAGLIIGGPLWGAISDRIFKTRKWIIFWGHVLMIGVVCTMAFLSSGAGYLILGLLLFLFGITRATGPLMYPHIKDSLPLDMAGAAMAGVNFFTMFGSAFFLQGLGSLMQYLFPNSSRGPEAFSVALIFCAVCLVGMTIGYMFSKDSMGETVHR